MVFILKKAIKGGSIKELENKQIKKDQKNNMSISENVVKTKDPSNAEAQKKLKMFINFKF